MKWLILGLLLLIGACTPSSDEIRIGYVGPLTGPVAHTGRTTLDGLLLAHSINPSAGNIPVEIIIEDDQCNPRIALTAAKTLIEVQEVDVLISGVCSSSTLALAPYAAEQGILLVSAVAASPDLSDAGPHVFRASSSSELMADQAAASLNGKFSRIAIVQEIDPYPAGWTRAFTDVWQGEITSTTTFQPGEKDLSGPLLKAMHSDPDAIFIITLSPATALQLLHRLEELGWDRPIIGNEAVGLAPVRKDPVSEGILVLSYEIDTTPLAEFEERYTALHGHPPSEERYSILGSDAYLMILHALEQCGPETVCMQKWLDSQKMIEGIAGNFSLDKNGDAIRPFGLHTIRNGSLTHHASTDNSSEGASHSTA